MIGSGSVFQIVIIISGGATTSTPFIGKRLAAKFTFAIDSTTSEIQTKLRSKFNSRDNFDYNLKLP